MQTTAGHFRETQLAGLTEKILPIHHALVVDELFEMLACWMMRNSGLRSRVAIYKRLENSR